jgi:DNA primase
MKIDPQVAEICRRVKITDYLINKGVQLIRRGNRSCCRCPLPDHDDHDPSFYIFSLPDGTELFKCFGCGRVGNILSIMSAIDNENKGSILKKLSAQAGITLSKIEISAKLEPRPDEVEEIFCDEQDAATGIAQISVPFMQENPTEDVINKVSRMYEMIDHFVRLGDIKEIERYQMLLADIIDDYN